MEMRSKRQKDKNQSQSQQQQLFFRSREKDFQNRRKNRLQLLSNANILANSNSSKAKKKHQQAKEMVAKQQNNIINDQKNNQKQEQDQIDIFDQKLEEKDKLQQEISKYAFTDELGYYNVIVGSIIKNKYKIIQKVGKGVFGVVLKVQKIQQQTIKPQFLAVKVLRKNPITEKSGIRQYGILKKLALNFKSTTTRSYIMQAYQHFYQNGHLFIVCQLMGDDLRTYLHKNQTKITLKLIREYAICIFMSLHQLRKNKIVHADIKPDNFLIDLNDPTKVKLADFGTAYSLQEHVITEDLVARYYRAPEIVLGCQFQQQYLYGIDTWAVGCSLYELYTGSFLFNANSNNQLLKQMMQTCGKFNIKMLNKSLNMNKHFDSNYNFVYQYVDKNNKNQKSQKMQITITAERQLLNLIKQNKRQIELNMQKEEVKKLHQFKDLLEKCLMLNPKDRITPFQAMAHPFISYQIKLQ